MRTTEVSANVAVTINTKLALSSITLITAIRKVNISFWKSSITQPIFGYFVIAVIGNSILNKGKPPAPRSVKELSFENHEAVQGNRMFHLRPL